MEFQVKILKLKNEDNWDEFIFQSNISTFYHQIQKAIKLFEDKVNKFRNICDLKTICMHGVVLSKYDNRDLWKYYDFKDFGVLGETYLAVAEELNYFTDTGRGWK